MRGSYSSSLFVLAFLLIGTLNESLPLVHARDFSGDYSKLSGIIIPGFATTQLRAWSFLDCPYSPFDFNPLDLVWLDSTKNIEYDLVEKDRVEYLFMNMLESHDESYAVEKVLLAQPLVVQSGSFACAFAESQNLIV
ncbi:hypothetical protein GIB67_030233 [Kingdonia uniflora]|uniref:Uncharacterized protein n=1 Tax=Kingdonia uniflora TaxID=39325 RepID=A0A7J7MN63_9MAGN|nr:hypothetical protein GIB67_030233 [Kingdonia uniflora]